MFRSLFYIGMIAVGLLSCSPNDWEQTEAPGTQAEEDGKAYLTISLSLPRTSETRSQTDQQGGSGADGSEQAKDTECKITNAWVILGELASGQQAPVTISQKYYVDKFHYTGNPAQWTTTIPCKPGKYRVAIIVNPGNKISLHNQLTHWDELARYVLKYDSYTEMTHIWKDNEFLMTNAYQGRNDENDVQLVRGEHTYKDLHVQRVCARFDYKVESLNNVYQFTCPLNGTPDLQSIRVQLTDVGLVNISNNFNLFKMVVPDIQPGRVPNFYQHETSENYVYDSDWENKWILQMPTADNTLLRNLFFFPSERETTDPTLPVPESFSYLKLPTALDHTYTQLTYASENTLPGMLAQINKLSTGVVFKGKFTLPDQPEVKTVYYRTLSHSYECYTSYEALKTVLEKEGYPTLTTEPSDKEWAQLGVMKYTQQADGTFPVFYTYWNRHNDNLKPQEMGIMEFAVVRNNVYKLAVRQIGSLGLPKDPTDPTNPWKPNGNTPDEQLPQIDVTVEVCEWVNREMEHEI